MASLERKIGQALLSIAMDDREMVAAIRTGDRLGLATLYDAYAAQLYGFCWSLLHDKDAAADVLQDTFVIVDGRIKQLRDPDKLRPWLFAIARHECLRVLKTRTRTMPLDEAGDMADESVDLVAEAHERELRKLVWDAANGLNTGEREVLELNVRHGLESEDLALALGVSVNHAHARLSRAREQMDRSLTALILARTGTQDCDVLASMLGDWDGTLTPLLRKRINRHVEQCDACGERKKREVRASALLAMLPLAVLPAELARRVSDSVEEPELVSYRERTAEAAGPFDWAGFPTEEERKRRRWLVPMVAGVAMLLLIGGTVTTVLIRDAGASHRTVSLPLPTTATAGATTAPATTAPPDTTATSTVAPTTTTVTATTTVTTRRTTVTTKPTTKPAVAPPTTTTTGLLPPPPPVLTVTPQVLVLGSGSFDDTGTATLCVANGSASWSASPKLIPGGTGKLAGLGISPASGTTTGCVPVTFSVNNDIQPCSGAFEADFASSAGNPAITVSWNTCIT